MINFPNFLSFFIGGRNARGTKISGQREILCILPFFGEISVFTQSDHEFKKYQLQKKYIFQQLGMKIANFADISEITAYLGKGKKCILKPQRREK